MRTRVIALLGLALLAGPAFALEPEKIADPVDRINYSIGYQIGADLRQQGLDLNPQALVRGIDDVRAGTAPVLEPKEMSDLLLSLKKDIVASEREKLNQERIQIKEQYRGEGREFLAKNSGEKGVVTLPSGLQYKVEREGSGKSPGLHDTVKVHYRGTQLNGTEFDSSYRANKPAEFRVDGVIAGWTEALQLMKEGAKWRIFVPADLAYGERGPLADRAVIFDIELLAVTPADKQSAAKKHK